MTQSSAAVFGSGLDFFGDVVARLESADWARPSPCEGWSARDVLGHLGSSIAFGIAILRGDQPSWPDAATPGDLVEGDPAAYWSASPPTPALPSTAPISTS